MLELNNRLAISAFLPEGGPHQTRRVVMGILATSALADASATNPEHREALARLFTRMGELTTLPTQAARLLAIPDDDSASMEELVDIVLSDPPTSTRVLRRVNSSYYGLPNQVAEIPLAVNLLGMREMRNIALTATVSKLFSSSDSLAAATGYNREELWMYSVAVAKAAAVIAQQGRRVSPPTAYAAGMLHDIGYFILDQHLQTHFLRLVALARHRAKDSLHITALEEETLSFHHATLGGFVAAGWGIPDSICAAIEHHHHFACYEGEHRGLVACVVLALHLCAELGWTSLGLPVAPIDLTPAYGAAGVKATDAAEIREKIVKAIDEASSAAVSR